MPAFRQIEFLAVVYGLVFRMPQNQIRDVKFGSKLTGIPDRAVMLFIWLEMFAFAIQAEGFMQQPVTAFHIRTAERIVRLITCAGQPTAVREEDGESILSGLGGVDIKKGHIIVQNMAGLSVADSDQMDAFPDCAVEFVLESQPTEGVNGRNQI